MQRVICDDILVHETDAHRTRRELGGIKCNVYL